MNDQESISRLEEASVFGIKPGLDRLKKILAVLGNPEKACKMIHITGTNGKGSVAAMITSVLENTNLRVGRFTSPHLIDYTERIYLGVKDISREDFAKAATVVFKAHDELIAAGEEALTASQPFTGSIQAQVVQRFINALGSNSKTSVSSNFRISFLPTRRFSASSIV